MGDAGNAKTRVIVTRHLTQRVFPALLAANTRLWAQIASMAVSTAPIAPPGIHSPHRTAGRRPMEPNVKNIVLGERHIRPEYPSFYPEDLVGGKKTEWLYVCQWCFKYTNELLKFSAHCVSDDAKH